MESFLIRGRALIQEDALTAALGDLLEDLADVALVEDLLANARCVGADGKPVPSGMTSLPLFDDFSVRLWPSWAEGEPDLLLTLRNNGSATAAIVLEIKYEASKSGRDSTETAELNDQLGRYATGLANTKEFEGALWVVVYVTGSATPPVDELSASWKSIQTRKLDPCMLRWMSWRDIDRVLSKTCKKHESSLAGPVAWRRIDKVRRLLQRAGLECFEGWRTDSTLPPPPQPPTDSLAWLPISGSAWRVEAAPPPLPPAPIPHETKAGWAGWLA